MRVLVATVGTRGDVQPYVALAIGLKAAGHQVRICTCCRFRSFVEKYGIGFSHLDEGLLHLLESEFGRSLVENISGLVGALRTVPSVIRQVGPIHRRMVTDCWRAVEAHDPDVIVYHPKMFCVPAFAARRKIPAVLGMLCPLHVPTGESPLFGVSLGRYYNRATYQLTHQLTQLATRRYLADWREKHDPNQLSRNSGPMRISLGCPVHVVHGYSATVCPRPADWPSTATVSGYWFLPRATDDDITWQPSSELLEFLHAGPPPIYIGFGSMARSDPSKTTRLILSAVKQVGTRAVIATGWGGIDSGSDSANVHVVKSAPHDWLFPRMAAVVHHGGAGTTAAGLRAGCPTAICPFGLDQPFWARRVAALGAGIALPPQKKVTRAELAVALGRLISDQSMRSAAERVANSIQREDGVTNAVNSIQQAMHSWTGS